MGYFYKKYTYFSIYLYFIYFSLTSVIYVHILYLYCYITFILYIYSNTHMHIINIDLVLIDQFIYLLLLYYSIFHCSVLLYIVLYTTKPLSISHE